MAQNKEILIAEDSPTQAEQLKYTLEQHGYSVVVAANGKEALAAMRKKKPIIVISDIVMPEMDGYELCRQVKNDPDLEDVPVILLTSLSDAKDVLQSLECGAHHFLTKPYEEEDLLSRIDYVLSNRRMRKGKKVDVGLEIMFEKQKYFVSSEHMQILDLLLSTYEAAVKKNQAANKATEELRILNEQLEDKVQERTAALTAEIAERKRAEAELEKTLSWQHGVSLVQQALLSRAPLNEKLKMVTESVVRLFDADFCRIWLTRHGDLCDQDCVHAKISEGPHICRHRDRCLHLIASAGRYTHIDGKMHRRVPFGCYKIGRIASGQDHRFLTNDVPNDPRIHDHEWARSLGLVSFAGYQLRVPGGKAIGVMALFARHTLSPAEDALLDGLSSAVAQVVQQAVAEDNLRRSEERFRELFRSMGSGVAVYGAVEDGKDFVFQNLNEAGEAISKVRRDDVVGRRITEILPGVRETGLLDVLRKVWETGIPAWQAARLYKDKRLAHWVENYVYRLSSGDIVVIYDDVTARKEAEQKLLFTNAILSTQQEVSIDGILVVDESGRIVSYNHRFVEMWGIPPDIVEKKEDEPVLRIVADRVADAHSFIRRVQSLYENRQETSRDEIVLKDGRTFDRYSAPMCGANDQYFGRVWYFRDITERKQAELALRRVNRALKVTSDCNQVLIRATQESALLNDVCRILVTVGEYDSAWVGYVDKGSGALGEPVAFAGRGRKLPLFTTGAIAVEEAKHRPAYTAIKTGKPFVLQCPQSESALNPWQIRMQKAGYAAAAAFPLFVQHRVVGVLSMYSKDACAFAEDEMRLLGEMADDLAFGIQTIRMRTAHAKTVETLKENEERYHHLFESLYDAAFLADGRSGTILDANRQAEVLLGKRRADIIGARQSDFLPPAHAEKAKKLLDMAVAEAGAVAEAEVVRKDGAVVPVSVSASSLTLGGMPLVLSLFRDITDSRQAEQRLKDSAAKLQQMMEGSIKAMGSALEARDPYTAGHERRVAQLAFAIASEMGLDKGKCEGIRIAGYVHDLGKIAVPAEILAKPGRISELEFGIIKTHPQSGYDILKEIDFVWPVAQATLQHHERLDGSGYPQGLKGEKIIIEARILAVADVVEAMSSHRPYRAALGCASAMDEITKRRGVLYDAVVVDSCVRLFGEKGFAFE